jgi:dGTPase
MNSDTHYSSFDEERYLPEQHSGIRSDFARDRARVLHSSAWRRLAAKTQVLSPQAGVDFARNRLTHSLEVAQVGRELAVSLDLSPDVVDTACLAHDLGHPPFGHNGELALNNWAEDIGGFEGNAQTLRVLTRLEPKVITHDGRSLGLNLTRATLDASCKYPWSQSDAEIDPSGRAKFGYFDDDREIFEWVRLNAPSGRACIEAQIMDLSDDIAYSVHDFEDAVVGEHIDPAILTSRSGHEALIQAVSAWAGNRFSDDDLTSAFDRITSAETWVSEWDGSRATQAKLKNFTSHMIGSFARASITATRAAFSADALVRFQADVVVPSSVQAEIAVLKGIVAAFVMAKNERQPTYIRQRELLRDVLDVLWAEGSGSEHLEPAYQADFINAESQQAAKRVIIDQVASLTDASAIAWHSRLCIAPLV